ncbi:hypothetical protein EUTSA_v10000592mg, partial [Eutrema salsugineum]
QLVTLIDSGSTHNFISEKTRNRLNLKITTTKPFTVKVADGFPLICRGKFAKVAVNLGGVIFKIYLFKIYLFAMLLTGLDLVIGIQWLEQLGPTICDWKTQSMEFTWAGAQRIIYGLKHVRQD